MVTLPRLEPPSDDPELNHGPVVQPATVMLLNARLLPIKVNPSVQFTRVSATVEVPALNVRFVMVVASSVPALLDRENVPLPKLRVRVPVPVMLKPGLPVSVTFGFIAEKSITHPLVHAPIVIAAIEIFPADEGQLAEAAPHTVTVQAARQELASKVALSPAFLGIPPVAAHVPPVPPVPEAHDAVFVLSQFPVPPTQKQVAACAESGSHRRSKRASNALRIIFARTSSARTTAR